MLDGKLYALKFRVTGEDHVLKEIKSTGKTSKAGVELNLRTLTIEPLSPSDGLELGHSWSWLVTASRFFGVR